MKCLTCVPGLTRTGSARRQRLVVAPGNVLGHNRAHRARTALIRAASTTTGDVKVCDRADTSTHEP